MSSKSDVTIVIATYNRQKSLKRTLEQLIRLKEKPPIIVVDNNSNDNTRWLCKKKFPKIEYIKLNKNIGIGARNIGVFNSKTPYIAFCDDDSWWKSGSLKNASEIFKQNNEIGLIAGKVLIGQNKNTDPACLKMKNSPIEKNNNLPGIPILGFISCASIVRKDYFINSGGFEQKYIVGGEENLLALNMRQKNYKLIYSEDIVAYHFPSNQRLHNYRYSLLVRNDLWTLWLKRHWPQIFNNTYKIIRNCNNPLIRNGFLKAIIGIPWIILRRKPISLSIEKELQILNNRDNP